MTLQEKYNAINEGAFPKQQFLRDARLAFPQIISQFNNYEDAATILKNRGVIYEADKKPEPIKFDPADTIAPDVLDHGIKAELEKKGLPVNETPSEEEYLAAKKKAVKNLVKDVNFYKNVQTMASSKSDQMEKVKMNESTLRALKSIIQEAKLAEEMVVNKKLQDIADSDTAKVAQGAAIALDALKKFYASAENLTRKLEKAYKVTGPFMAPALGAAVVSQINDIVAKPYKAEMPKAKMVNIAKIDDFETLSKETGISVEDLKAMQKQFKTGNIALPRANEADTNTTDFQGPTQRPDGTYNVDYLKEGCKYLKENDEPVIIDGKEVDVHSITADGVDLSDYPDFADAYADSAEFMDGTPLSNEQLAELDDKYPDLVQMAAHDSLYEGKGKKGYNALNEWVKLLKENNDGYYVNGREVDYDSIVFEKFWDSQDNPQYYADQARFMDGSILDKTELNILNQEYFDNEYPNPEDFYDEDEFSDR